MLQLVVPALLQSADHLDLPGEARLAKLDLLLCRGRKAPLAGASLEALLCRELGIKRQQDWPIAPLTLAQAGGEPGADRWLRADPVHLRLERDGLVLDEIAEPDPDEAQQLCAALAVHFGADFSPRVLRPGAWVVRAAGKADIETTPLSLAAGRLIDPLLPAGAAARHWHRLLNEVQMLLFHHPLNQAREARGEPAINSVWLWGGGRLPALSTPLPRSVLCRHPDWQALARFAGADARPLPEQWRPDLPPNALLILDEPHRQWRQGNLDGWRQALRDFETRWLQPLLAAARPFRLDDPLQGNSLYWRSAYRWKFWRRPPKRGRQTFDLPPPEDSGIDAFGNRY